MSDDEILAVVRAHKEGKQIQSQFVMQPQLGWYDLDSENSWTWDFLSQIYRVKPEPRKPREWIIHIPDDHNQFEVKASVFPPDSSGHNFGYVDGCQCIRVREVIEE